MGPETLLQASAQVDLFDIETGVAYEKGYHLLPEPQGLRTLNERLRPRALFVRSELESHGKLSADGKKAQAEVNHGCDEMVAEVYKQSRQVLSEGKRLGLLGGDHSTPEGGIRAISEKYRGEFGILHIDAHADLREAYQGFKHSHASIMNNVMSAEWRPQRLVQVGIRDFCQEEYEFIRKNPAIKTFFDLELKKELLAGVAWSQLCRQIVEALPQNVYVSFDIDGLSPEFCPHTGTPVPGGLSFDQALFLLWSINKSGRKVIGFDLNEVAPGSDGDEWDGNVGARLLYKLCGWTVLSD